MLEKIIAMVDECTIKDHNEQSTLLSEFKNTLQSLRAETNQQVLYNQLDQALQRLIAEFQVKHIAIDGIQKVIVLSRVFMAQIFNENIIGKIPHDVMHIVYRSLGQVALLEVGQVSRQFRSSTVTFLQQLKEEDVPPMFRDEAEREIFLKRLDKLLQSIKKNLTNIDDLVNQSLSSETQLIEDSKKCQHILECFEVELGCFADVLHNVATPLKIAISQPTAKLIENLNKISLRKNQPITFERVIIFLQSSIIPHCLNINERIMEDERNVVASIHYKLNYLREFLEDNVGPYLSGHSNYQQSLEIQNLTVCFNLFITTLSSIKNKLSINIDPYYRNRDNNSLPEATNTMTTSVCNVM